MPIRNRVIYQSQGVFVSSGLATGVHYNYTGAPAVNYVNQLYRITSANNNFNQPRTDVVQFGQIDPVALLIVSPAAVSLDLTWNSYSMENEARMGFVTDGIRSPISGFLSSALEPKNYFLATAPEGSDLVGYTGASSTVDVMGFGNGYIASYSTQGRVGGLPTTNVQVQALNQVFYTNSSGVNIPAVDIVNNVTITGQTFVLPVATSGVNGEVPAIRPGDIVVNIASAGLGVDLTNIKIQSYNLSFSLNRQNIDQLGTFYEVAKVIQPPIPATLAIEAERGELATGDLHSLFCNDALYDIFVTLYAPSCTGRGPVQSQYEFRGAQINSEAFTNDVGANSRVTFNYETRISAGASSIRGVYFSGVSSFGTN